MEVHHHPEVEKKGFKEYILEGLMIFVAVMMGFIAENVRENITNGEHAKQLTSQLVQDIRADTVTLNEVYGPEKQIIRKSDTLFELLQKPMAQIDAKRMQDLIVASYSFWPFYETIGSINAIKNELHLKQFASTKIIRYIAQYEGRARLVHKIEDIVQSAQSRYVETFCRLHFTPKNLNAAFTHRLVFDGQMRSITQADLTQFSNDIVLLRSYTNELVDYNRRLKTDATKLMDYVTKQYDLGDE